MVYFIINSIIISLPRIFLTITTIPFLATKPGRLYRHIIRFKSWPIIIHFKKHKAIDHCQNVPIDLLRFRIKWNGVRGIYKITFLPFRLFTYYGSSVNLGQRFKYHYFITPKSNNFLGLFIKVFGWSCFSITVIETCTVSALRERENWYLSIFCPLLNVMIIAYGPRQTTLSNLTRSKISISLTNRKDSDETRRRKSESRTGNRHPLFGIGIPKEVLDKAAEVNGTKIYVYDARTFSLVNNTPFRSIRLTAKNMPIGARTLPNKLDTGKPFKGFYYYTSPQKPPSEVIFKFKLEMPLS